jgi:hypothetical protein
VGRTTLEQIDEEFRPLVSAIFAAIAAAGYEVVPELCERTIHNATYDIVGRFDLTLRHVETGELVLSDVKTGGTMWKPRRTKGAQVGWDDAHAISDLQEAMQLAAYVGATSLIRWPEVEGKECVVEAPPAWSAERGIIVHAPSTGTEVALRVLDLAVGREGLEVAKAVRAIRNAKPLMERIGEPAPALPTPEVANPIEQPADPFEGIDGGVAEAEPATEAVDLVESMKARIMRLAKANPPAMQVVKVQLANAYGVQRASELDSGQMAEFATWLHGLEQDIPIEDIDTPPVVAPTPITLVAPKPQPWTRPQPEEGAAVRRSEVDLVQAAGRSIDGAGKSLLRALLGDMQRAGEPLQLDGKPTRRRVLIAQACVACAEWANTGEVSEDDVRELVVGVLRMDDQPSIPTGRLLAALTIDEAAQLCSLANGLAEGRGLHWTDNGPQLAAA